MLYSPRLPSLINIINERKRFMDINSKQHKQFKAIGHHLKPILIITHEEPNDNACNEFTRALADHELIKVQIRLPEKAARQQVIEQLAKHSHCQHIQSIGHMALFYKHNPKASKHLSNIQRYASKS